MLVKPDDISLELYLFTIAKARTCSGLQLASFAISRYDHQALRQFSWISVSTVIHAVLLQSIKYVLNHAPS